MQVELQSFKDKLLANEHSQNKGISSFQELQSSMSLNDPQIRSFIISRQQSRKKMNLLEEELKAELEHLQLHIESETMLYQEEKYSEIMVEETAPEGSLYTTNYGEIIDPPQVIHNAGQYGVCPHELESRLHELLEARQQERINELEEALHFANQKIQEKERDLSMWKDTAKIFFQQVPVHNERRSLTHQ
ncbi:hypothetical protein Leryth_012662 [Lithospermum erythrorhizon]|nr:hypothetical protein Leryth_012662 [Lithospermum erythrorhizon]